MSLSSHKKAIRGLQIRWCTAKLSREKNGQSAKCKQCKHEIKTAGGTTTGLHVHLKKHDIDLKKKRPSENSSGSRVFDQRLPLGYWLAEII